MQAIQYILFYLLPRNFFFSSFILDLLVHTNNSNRELEKKKRFSTIIQQYVLFSWIYQMFFIAWAMASVRTFLLFYIHTWSYVSLNSAQKLIEIEAWLLIFFLRLHNQLISIHSTATIFENCDSSKRHKLMVASFSFSTGFTAKFQSVIMTQENAFSKRFHFMPNRKSIGSSKKRY